MKPFRKDTVILLVANPVDILTYFCQKYSGLPRGQVIGSGTFLDTARLRGILGQKIGIDAGSVEAYVLGEHGESQLVSHKDIKIYHMLTKSPRLLGLASQSVVFPWTNVCQSKSPSIVRRLEQKPKTRQERSLQPKERHPLALVPLLRPFANPSFPINAPCVQCLIISTLSDAV